VRRLVFLGLPTSGKSTLSSRLAASMRIAQINAGQCLRMAAAQNATLRGMLANGRLASDELAAEAVRKGIGASSEYVLDGFPRTLSQLTIFDRWPQSRGARFVLLDLDTADLRRRFLARMNCTHCHLADYAAETPRRCRNCGGPLVARDDASDRAFDAKLEAFRDREEPMIARLAKQRRLDRIAVTGDAERDMCTLLDAIDRQRSR
jgi:adenylate kinase family enzyme